MQILEITKEMVASGLGGGGWGAGEEERTNIKINQPQIFPTCIWSLIVLYIAMVKDSENGLCKAPCAIRKRRKKENSLFRKRAKLIYMEQSIQAFL